MNMCHQLILLHVQDGATTAAAEAGGCDDGDAAATPQQCSSRLQGRGAECGLTVSHRRRAGAGYGCGVADADDCDATAADDNHSDGDCDAATNSGGDFTANIAVKAAAAAAGGAAVLAEATEVAVADTVTALLA